MPTGASSSVNMRRPCERIAAPLRVLNRLAEAYLGSYLDIDGERTVANGCGISSATKRSSRRRWMACEAQFSGTTCPLRKKCSLSGSTTSDTCLLFRLSRDSTSFPRTSISALDDSLARVAVASLVASRPPSPEPAWVRPLFESHPNVAAEEIVRFATAALRRGEQQISFVYEMLDYEWLSEVARIACPRLLRAFPVRAPRRQFNVLKRLLWWGTGNLKAPAMEPIVAAKLAARSMTASQRAYWHAAQLAVSSEPNLAGVEAFAEKHADALSGFFEFYQRPFDPTPLLRRLPSPSLGRLARLLGARSHPLRAVRSEPAKLIGSELVRVMLEVLGTRAEDDALRALAELGDDSRKWRLGTRLSGGYGKSSESFAEMPASERPGPCESVLPSPQRAGSPTNVADLACSWHVREHRRARDCPERPGRVQQTDWLPGLLERPSGRTSSWRPRRTKTIAGTPCCRTVSSSSCVPLGVEVAFPKGRYAGDEALRSDIRVYWRMAFNVPVEIKKSSNRKLVARDPRTS